MAMEPNPARLNRPPKVRVLSSGPGKGEIWIDDFKVPFPMSIGIDMGVGRDSTVVIEMLVSEVEVDGPMTVKIESVLEKKAGG